MNLQRKNKIIQTLTQQGFQYTDNDLIAINEIMKGSTITYEEAVNQWSANHVQPTQQTQTSNAGFNLNVFIDESAEKLAKSIKQQVLIKSLNIVASDYHAGNFLDVDFTQDLNVLGDITSSLKIEPTRQVLALAPVLDNHTEYPLD